MSSNGTDQVQYVSDIQTSKDIQSKILWNLCLYDVGDIAFSKIGSNGASHVSYMTSPTLFASSLFGV